MTTTTEPTPQITPSDRAKFAKLWRKVCPTALYGSPAENAAAEDGAWRMWKVTNGPESLEEFAKRRGGQATGDA
jgi:hypothetical protein